MKRLEELKELQGLIDVVDLPWVDEGDTSIVTVNMVSYSVLPDVEDAGKYRAYYGKGRYKQVSSVEEGKLWVAQDHLKGKLLNLLKLKEL